jgi:hypothetical protein
MELFPKIINLLSIETWKLGKPPLGKLESRSLQKGIPKT